MIVLLHEPLLADLDDGLATRERDDLRARHLAVLEQRFVADAASHGFSAGSGLSHLPIVFGQIHASRLVELARLTSVKAIESQHAYALNDVEGGNLTGGIPLRNQFGATGSGVGVAIVDTGIDFSHPEFGGRIAAQLNLVGAERPQDDEGQDEGGRDRRRLDARDAADSSGR